MHADVIVVGAGVAGLQCARRLSGAGRNVVIVDRARGVGGRCATRRIDDQPVDLGPMFLHGRQPAFLAALDELGDAARLGGWPRRVRGSGKPCQPDAFVPGERRTARADGLSAFPRHLARGLDVRLRTTVERIVPGPGSWTLRLAGGEEISAPDVVLALALEQSLALLDQVGGGGEIETARALLGMFSSLPCLTVIGMYGDDAPVPDFDVRYPEASEVLTLVAHDSAKRPEPRALALVFQAEPRWSREHLGVPEEEWSTGILAAAGDLLGSWAATPRQHSSHRWTYARVDRGNELTSPLLIRGKAGARLGLAGDVFAPGGGIQASYLSGDHLATRLLDEE